MPKINSIKKKINNKMKHTISFKSFIKHLMHKDVKKEEFNLKFSIKLFILSRFKTFTSLIFY